MARFFNFYDPLEKRYVFNSFLVVVALVEILILVSTLIWQIDFEGLFLGAPPHPVPFPWRQYLLAAFIAPIALMFLFGLIIQGFERLCGPEGTGVPGGPLGKVTTRLKRWRYLLGLLLFMAALGFFSQGKAALGLLVAGIKAIGLGGSYLLVALLALALLYLPLRLLLRYRLQKKAMEYQYLLTLAARHGVMVVDPRQQPELAARLIAAPVALEPEAPKLPGPDAAPDAPAPEAKLTRN